MNVEQFQTSGVIVTWEVPHEVAYNKLLEAMNRSNLDESMVRDMSHFNALKRALKDMEEQRIIRQLERRDHIVAFQFTKEFLENSELRYEREAYLALDLDTGQLMSDDMSIQLKAEELLREHMGKRLGRDLTRLVQRIFKNSGKHLVPLRNCGGVYFVPDDCLDIVEAVDVLLSEIGGKLRIMAVGADERSKQSIGESMVEYFNTMISRLQQSIEQLDEDTSSTVMMRRADAIRHIQSELSNYAGLLGAMRQGVEKHLEEAAQKLIEVVAKSAQGTGV